MKVEFSFFHQKFQHLLYHINLKRSPAFLAYSLPTELRGKPLSRYKRYIGKLMFLFSMEYNTVLNDLYFHSIHLREAL